MIDFNVLIQATLVHCHHISFIHHLVENQQVFVKDVIPKMLSNNNGRFIFGKVSRITGLTTVLHEPS